MSILLLDVETDMKIYHGMEYIVDISKGFTRDILGDLHSFMYTWKYI